MSPALARRESQPLSLAQNVRLLAPALTCSQLAQKLGVPPGRVARCAMNEGLGFCGVPDKGAWPRRGGPAQSLIPFPKPSTVLAFERAAAERGTDPLSLAQACLDTIAAGNLFAAVLDR